MKLDRKILTISLIGLYLFGMIISAYSLFNIEEALIYDLQILDISEAAKADSVFYGAYIVVGLTMIVGLLAIYYSFKYEEANVIYVERTKEETKEEKEQRDIDEKNQSSIERKELDKFLKVSKPAEAKNLESLLNNICKKLQASQGALYIAEKSKEKRRVVLKASYAIAIAESEVIEFEYGEGLVGQVAKEQKTIHLDDVPKGYIKIISGLGESSPSHLLIIPVKSGEELIGVVEIASFVAIMKEDISILEKFLNDLGDAITGNSSIKGNEPELVTAETETKSTKKTKKDKKKTEDK